MKLFQFITYPKSILVTLLILFLSFSPPSNFEKLPDLNLFNHFDKFAHYLMYLVLTFMLIFESRNDKITKLEPFTLALICIVFPVILGGVIEILQKYLFPPRSAELIDWLANIAGVLTAWFLMILFQKIKSRTV
ncbi:MAG TPA: VanZ family protein [Paludibacter sp.]|nr:VanZ family protein [Paludibacter sp.]